MSRELIEAFHQAGLQIASSTFEVVGVPPLRLMPSAESLTKAS
jgi:hypothetical protein